MTVEVGTGVPEVLVITFVSFELTPECPMETSPLEYVVSVAVETSVGTTPVPEPGVDALVVEEPSPGG
jgi:hypothetical protein